MSSGLSENLKRAQELLGKFMGRMGGTEELSFDKGLLTDDKIGSWHTFRVCQALVMALSFGNGSFKFLVKFI